MVTRRRVRRLLLIAATTACSIFVPESGGAEEEPSVLNRSRYVEEVLRAGLGFRVAEAEAALSQAESVGAGAWPNPAVTWQRESAGSAPRSAPGITQDIFALSVPLVLSGRLGLEREAALGRAHAARARMARTRAELRYEAVQRFHAAVTASRRRAVLADSHAGLSKLSAVMTAREKAGDASGYERLRISLEAASVNDLFRGAAVDERRAQSDALALLGPAYTRLPRFDTSREEAPQPLLTNAKALFEQFEMRRADLRGLTLEVKAAETTRRAADRGWIPEPTAVGGLQLLDAGQPGSTSGYVVGLEVPLPVFQRRQGEIARASARGALAEARRAALMREIVARLNAAVTEVVDRRARVELHRIEVLTPAERLQQIAVSAYRGGASDLLVLVDAERVAREARLAAIDHASALHDAETAVSLLAGLYEEPEERR